MTVVRFGNLILINVEVYDLFYHFLLTFGFD